MYIQNSRHQNYSHIKLHQAIKKALLHWISNYYFLGGLTYSSLFPCTQKKMVQLYAIFMFINSSLILINLKNLLFLIFNFFFQKTTVPTVLIHAFFPTNSGGRQDQGSCIRGLIVSQGSSVPGLISLIQGQGSKVPGSDVSSLIAS